MTPLQTLNILVGISAISIIAVAIYWLQERLNVDHGQRLIFLKMNLVVTWIVAIASITILVFNAGVVVGQLIPVGEAIGQVILSSRVQMFEADHTFAIELVLAFYLLGLSLMLVRFVRSYLRMRTIIMNSSPLVLEGQSVRSLQQITSPFSFGILSPQIFIPMQMIEESSGQVLKVIFEHEHTHIQNKDPQWKMLSLLTRVFLFFTPTAFYLHRKLELETEVECDRLTMEKTELSAQVYGNLLIDTVASTQFVQANPMFTYMSDNNLNRRIQAMTNKTFKKPVLRALLSALVFIGSITAVAATTGAAKLTSQFIVKLEIFRNGVLISAPKFVVLEGEPAELSVGSENPESHLKIKLIADNFTGGNISGGIDLKMDFKFQAGDQSAHAKPRIVVIPGEQGTVSISNSSSGALEMRVVAERL